MKENVTELINTVIENDYCSGCGVCSSVKDSPLNIKMNDDGKYMPFLNGDKNKEIDVLSICPFSNNKNEDEIASELYEHIEGIKHNEYTGYYIKNYAGYVKTGKYREKGSSGGMGTWIATQLLNKNLIDGIIHVKSSKEGKEKTLFSYQISNTVEELYEGSKSRYYPVEMSEVLKYVRENPGRYALVGIPCFIKGFRLLSGQDDVIKERVKFTIGLICGHLKTDMFARSIAWEMGIKPDKLEEIDFRAKIEGRNASDYGVKVKGRINGEEVIRTSPTKQLYTTNWGQGLFKYKACDFCDDILAETADITVGDAWLPQYVKDSMGTNIIIVRNPVIMKIIEENNNDLHLEEISIARVFASQAGGFRHRREGLSYRLYMKDEKNEWRPRKRVNPSNNLSRKRKNIYEMRVKLYEESYKSYKIAEEKESFNEFINYIDPIVNNYKKLSSTSLIIRVFNKIKRIIVAKS